MVFRRIIREQQAIGNILPTTGRKVLLPKTGGPTQALEDRPNQVVLSLAFVGCLIDWEAIEDGAELAFEDCDTFVIESLPVLKFDY